MTAVNLSDATRAKVLEAYPVFDRTWRASCSIERTARRNVDAMIKRHYLKRWPGVCTLTLAMKRATELVGVIVYALPPRETSKRYGGKTWELARLWIDDLVPKNGETWLIAKSIDYIKRNHPSVKILVSYADPSVNHTGVVYRAANWTADGRTDQERKTPRFDYADANTGRRYSRRGHVPADVIIKRIARISKHRFVYRLWSDK